MNAAAVKVGGVAVGVAFLYWALVVRRKVAITAVVADVPTYKRDASGQCTQLVETVGPDGKLIRTAQPVADDSLCGAASSSADGGWFDGFDGLQALAAAIEAGVPDYVPLSQSHPKTTDGGV